MQLRADQERVCYVDKRGVLGRLSGRSHWLKGVKRPIAESYHVLGEDAYHAGRLGWWAALSMNI
jgi:hypothetical protein